VALTVVSSLCFIAATLLFLPETWVPIAASVPLLLFLFGYSYAKRFTALAHYWLGAALMLSPWAAWIATGGPIWAPGPILLGLAVLLWVGGFDIIYACQDVDFDRKAKLRSIPAKFGIRGALRIAAGSHLAMVLVLLLIPSVYPSFGLVFYIGVGVIALVLVYEHLLVSPDDLRRVGRAFFHVNAVVSMGLLVIGLVDLLW